MPTPTGDEGAPHVPRGITNNIEPMLHITLTQCCDTFAVSATLKAANSNHTIASHSRSEWKQALLNYFEIDSNTYRYALPISAVLGERATTGPKSHTSKLRSLCMFGRWPTLDRNR